MACDSVPSQRRKTCAIAGKMGVVGVIDDGMVYMVEMGGAVLEIYYYKGRRRE